ncbi:MAG: peptide-methionine (S)-S-oxide reductase MsrA [Alphaproteobacteria bacterium]|nr:peptide-methionine (S)-S-oxide reductase MsrA [Alphaproteobacteria bacterium]
MKLYALLILFGGLLAFGLFLISKHSQAMNIAETIMNKKPDNAEIATFAGGCFWCLESEFRSLEGVLYTVSGYTGGALEHPTYRDITTGKTGHAEAVEIYFDPGIVSYQELLDYFLRQAHDPTQLNRQGVDKGTQYRSAIFYHDDAQKHEAESAIQATEKDKIWKNKIVTELSPAVIFWPAEDYHQQYYEKYERENGRPHIRVLLKKKK